MHQAGLAGMTWPKAYGGHGLTLREHLAVNKEIGALPMPESVSSIGKELAGPIIMAVGDEAQKQAFLPEILTMRQFWCQGFSEPDAGSDLARLRTKAVQEGEHWRINGQKIWTSGAMWADWCLLLLRTEADQPRHRGLSMLVVDMTSAGIERREITLANGSREFAEVFFDEVRVPAANLVGQAGIGWRIAMHMLTYERGPADMGWVGRLGHVLAAAVEDVRTGRCVADGPLRRRLAACAVNIDVLRWQVARSLVDRAGVAASVDKLLTTRIEQELFRVVGDLAGTGFVQGDDRFDEYLWSRAQSIYGGTQQIQRQIVAQRVLGLPRG